MYYIYFYVLYLFLWFCATDHHDSGDDDEDGDLTFEHKIHLELPYLSLRRKSGSQ